MTWRAHGVNYRSRVRPTPGNGSDCLDAVSLSVASVPLVTPCGLVSHAVSGCIRVHAQCVYRCLRSSVHNDEVATWLKDVQDWPKEMAVANSQQSSLWKEQVFLSIFIIWLILSIINGFYVICQEHSFHKLGNCCSSVSSYGVKCQLPAKSFINSPKNIKL